MSCVDYYFIEEDGGRFKVSMPFKPYFYVFPRKGTIQEVEAYLSKRFSGYLFSIEQIHKEDLDLVSAQNSLLYQGWSWKILMFWSQEFFLAYRPSGLSSRL